MSALVKLVIAGVLILGVFGIWRSVSAPTASETQDTSLDIAANEWVKGKSDAPVTLVEYTDFQCPACGAYYPIIKQLGEQMGDQVKIVIRHYPLVQIHKNALPGARAAEAAGRQGKFWDMYDLLFTNQAEWSTAEDPTKSILPAYAGRIGIDVEQFRLDMADSSIDDKINHDRETGNSLKITGTPSFFLNGKKLDNPKSFEDFKKTLEKAVEAGA